MKIENESPRRYILTTVFILLVLLIGSTGLAAQQMITVQLKVFPSDYKLYIDGASDPVPTFDMPEMRKGIRISRGSHMFRFTAEGYQEQISFIQCQTHNMLYETKLEKKNSQFKLLKQVDTRMQPKSVEFTPDGKHLVTTLLQDSGIQVYETEHFTEVAIDPIPEQYAEQIGFVEIAFVESRYEMWISQMTTHRVHIYDYRDFSYLGSINIGGNWSKVIAISPDEKTAYISNWISGDISVIDVAERKFLGLIPIGGTPRGIACSKDGKYLYVCRYDDGTIRKVNLGTNTVEKVLNWGFGAKRHIVLDEEKNIFYVSDMARNSLFIFNGEDDTLIKEIPIDYNPNTIALNSDNRYLFLATRGENHPETYLIKGYYFGKVYIFDTEKQKTIDWFWGMNQPTGMAVSPDDTYIAYSNFLDYTIEIYRTGLGSR